MTLANVHYIRYKNGKTEVINGDPVAVQNNDQADRQGSTPTEIIKTTSTPDVDSGTAWKNKWIYLGGMLGGGLASNKNTDTYEVPDYSNTGTRTVTDTYTVDDSGFSFGLVSEFALLRFLSLELDILGHLGSYFHLAIPIMVKLGYRFERIELFFDLGYTISLDDYDYFGGLSIGGTFGYNLGPGVLFLKILDIPPLLSYSGNIIMGFVGYKIGLMDKR